MGPRGGPSDNASQASAHCQAARTPQETVAAAASACVRIECEILSSSVSSAALFPLSVLFPSHRQFGLGTLETEVWVQMSTLPLPGCVTLDRSQELTTRNGIQGVMFPPQGSNPATALPSCGALAKSPPFSEPQFFSSVKWGSF